MTIAYDYHTIRARARSTITFYHTAAANTKLIVVTIVSQGTTGRGEDFVNCWWGTVPDQETFTRIAEVVAEETVTEIWYLLNPIHTGYQNVNFSNTNNVYCSVVVTSFTADGVMEYGSGNSNTGVSTNPTSNTITGLATGNLIVTTVGDGATTWSPSGQTGTNIYTVDDGAYGESVQYYIKTDDSDQTIGWTFGTSDDWGLAYGVFKENLISSAVLNTTDGTIFYTTTPTLEFTGTDPEGNPLQYIIKIDPLSTFLSDHYHDELDVSGANLNNGLMSYIYGQRFSISEQTEVSEGSVWLVANPGTTGTVYIDLYDMQHVMTGIGLDDIVVNGSPSINAASIPTSGRTRYNVTFPTNSLDPSRQYGIGVRFSGITGSVFVSGTTNTNAHYAEYFSSYPYYEDPEDVCFSATIKRALLTKDSSLDGGFENTVTSEDTSPFNSGEKVSYTLVTSLAPGTYYWKVKSKDPDGSNQWSDWTEARTFEIILPTMEASYLQITMQETTLYKTSVPFPIDVQTFAITAQIVGFILVKKITAEMSSYSIIEYAIGMLLTSPDKIYIDSRSLSITAYDIAFAIGVRFFQKITYLD